jgi:molybdopterin/thiamine biosynthesis adenylyltransferase
MTFSPEQIRRYSRHVLLPDVGGTGQSRLLSASVVVDGSGAAGRIAAAFLVASGVGAVTVDGALDRPVVAAAFPLAPGDTGRALHDALAAALGGRNPDVRIALGDAPADAHRLDLAGDADDLPLPAAFALAGAATSALLHHLATR